MKEGQYLEQHLEPNSSEAAKTLSHPKKTEELLPDSVKHEFRKSHEYKNGGVERITLAEGYLLEFSYQSLREDEVLEQAEYWKNAHPSLAKDIKKKIFRRLTGLSIKAPSGQSIDINRDFAVQNIFFTGVNKESYKTTGGGNSESVFLYFDINSPISLLALFHEIGHIVKEREDFEKAYKYSAASSHLKKGILSHFISGEEKHANLRMASEEILRNERDAWAVALLSLRPFLSAIKISPEDLNKTIHSFLSIYSENIRQTEQKVRLNFQDILSILNRLF